ncbi:hypothetical protein AN960_03715 [Bacillus sp. FJAT-25509]|uniref:DUF3888 domain-containing protein n=1 Tax=Bacillaceae TaxID=186817 RepID=UPI0006F3789C|nr:DUF3888 domain-containing protein [Bacillus sp. FJAT-25509]KQL42355.1 hypothetical protein AN960_03715 [Bacillus sp. FJAT-25509]
MNRQLIIILINFVLIFSTHSVEATKRTNSVSDNYFDINLTGFEHYTLSSYSQDKPNDFTSLAKVYTVATNKEKEWIDEPRIYIKANEGYIHIWKNDGTNVLYKIKKVDNDWEIVDVIRKKLNRIPVSKELLKDVLIERLTEPISQVVDRLWYRGYEKIIKIEKDKTNNIFYVTVQVQTFSGAHNPPYVEETITFRIKGSDIKAIDIKRRYIPEEEWIKIELR